MSVPILGRRQMLQRAGALAAGTIAAGFASALRTPILAGSSDLCATPARFDMPLHLPGSHGLMGRVAAGNTSLDLRAMQRTGEGPRLAFVTNVAGRECVNPILTVRRNDDLRIHVANGMGEPTIAHWHGLAVDTANDGNGEVLIEPGQSFTYAFTVRNRAGLYWYHPHPHGATASQVYRGLFGLIAIDDDEEDALRAALELVPGDTEIPLVLHDRRSTLPDRYAPTTDDKRLGWFGDETLVNFTARPYLEVTARHYRLRVLNAANARNFRLAFRSDNGVQVPFLLLGTDGGLLERAQPCTEVFVSPAERVDLLVDFSGIANGGFVLLESRAFEPMHSLPLPHAEHADAPAAERHVMRATASTPEPSPQVTDGAPLQLLQFRIRGRGGRAPPIPARLSTPVAIRADGEGRALRLGFANGRWRINDHVYEMAATPIVVARNAVETWLIRNYHSSMPHAMHLHGFHFRVLERETSPDQLAPLVVADRGRLATDLGWKDTVLLWPGESVKIAIDFRNAFAGEQIYLFHCHNLEHEDGGMMLRVKVG